MAGKEPAGVEKRVAPDNGHAPGRSFGLRSRRLPSPDSGLTMVGESLQAEPADRESAAREVIGAPDAIEIEGTAHAVGSSPERAITALLFAPERDPEHVHLEALPALVQDDANFVWVDLSGYGEADLRTVAGLLNLHRKAVRSALSPWQRPRLAVFADHFFVTATVARLDARVYRVKASQIDLFVGNNYLVTAHKSPLPFAAHLQARALGSPELLSLDAAFMLYLVLDELLAYYEELNRQVEMAVEQMEERALRDTSDAFLEDLLHFKRYAFALSQLADQHRELFAAFLRPDFTRISGEEVEDYYEDLQGRLERLLDALGEARDDVNGAFEIYVSHIAHRTNGVIKVLTIVSTILFSASVIIALFGATIQGSATYGLGGFVAMLLCIVVVCLSILYVFRRQRWL